nr:MAG TPA: hypothetical protein [Microviridae sp.]
MKIKKQEKNNWIVKVTYITEEYQYVVKHINMLDSTKEEVLRYAQSLGNCSTVCIYKLEATL